MFADPNPLLALDLQLMIKQIRNHRNGGGTGAETIKSIFYEKNELHGMHARFVARTLQLG